MSVLGLWFEEAPEAGPVVAPPGPIGLLHAQLEHPHAVWQQVQVGPHGPREQPLQHLLRVGVALSLAARALAPPPVAAAVRVLRLVWAYLCSGILVVSVDNSDARMVVQFESQ